MFQDYDRMGPDFGFDLEAQKAQRGVISQADGANFLFPPYRAEGTLYFGFVMNKVCRQRLKKTINKTTQRQKITGPGFVFILEKIVFAATTILFGLCSGADFATDDIKPFLPPRTCTQFRSSLGVKFGNEYYKQNVTIVSMRQLPKQLGQRNN